MVAMVPNDALPSTVWVCAADEVYPENEAVIVKVCALVPLFAAAQVKAAELEPAGMVKVVGLLPNVKLPFAE
jgi:hypothetical protein